MEPNLMEYFKVIVKEKQYHELKKWAVFNLPCFYFHYRNSTDERRLYFDSLIYEFC